MLELINSCPLWIKPYITKDCMAAHHQQVRIVFIYLVTGKYDLYTISVRTASVSLFQRKKGNRFFVVVSLFKS